MEEFYKSTWKDVVISLKSNIYSGLSDEDVTERRKKYGSNNITIELNKLRLVHNLFKIYLLLQIAIAVVLLLCREYAMSTISFLIFIINIVAKIIYIKKKNNNSAFINRINHTTTTVLRNNNEKVIPSSDLVVGDIVRFQKGSLIAADIRIIEAKDVLVNEKNITGEEFKKNKYESKMSSTVSSISEMSNILFKGSIIAEGEGYGVVVEVGNKTQFGKMLSLIYYSNEHSSSLSDDIESKFSKIMTMLVLLGFVSASIGLITKFSINSLAVSLFCISLMPLNILIQANSLLLKNNLRKNGIELINVSTLKSINEAELLFLDKIGSVTKKNLYVTQLFFNDSVKKPTEIDYDEDVTSKRLMDIALLCNNAKYNVDNDSGSGDLAEVAYLRIAANNKIYKSIIDSKHPREFDIPMDSDQLIYTTINKYKSGYRANVKGNVDDIIKNCTYIMADGEERKISPEDIEKIRGYDYNMSIQGLVVQAFAYRNFSYKPSMSENIESNMVFVGLIGMKNPFEEGIEEDISEINRRQMIPILFTQDNKIAATTIAKKVKIANDSSMVISEVELNSLTKDELKNTLERAKVFCKITPGAKNKIIGTYAKSNYNIVVSGENLSDLPALSMAKVAIAKGNAPQIVKKICDVYIKENCLKGFISLFDVSKNFISTINHNFYYYVSIILIQLIINGISSIIDSKINFIMTLIINLFVFLPLGVVNLSSKEKNFSKRNKIIRTVFWICLLILIMVFTSYDYNICALSTFGLIIIQNYIMHSTKNYQNVVLICFSLMSLVIGTIFSVLFYGIGLDIKTLVIMLVSLIISITIELILAKWE